MEVVERVAICSLAVVGLRFVLGGAMACFSLNFPKDGARCLIVVYRCFLVRVHYMIRSLLQ